VKLGAAETWTAALFGKVNFPLHDTARLHGETEKGRVYLLLPLTLRLASDLEACIIVISRVSSRCRLSMSLLPGVAKKE